MLLNLKSIKKTVSLVQTNTIERHVVVKRHVDVPRSYSFVIEGRKGHTISYVILFRHFCKQSVNAHGIDKGRLIGEFFTFFDLAICFLLVSSFLFATFVQGI